MDGKGQIFKFLFVTCAFSHPLPTGPSPELGPLGGFFLPAMDLTPCDLGQVVMKT